MDVIVKKGALVQGNDVVKRASGSKSGGQEVPCLTTLITTRHKKDYENRFETKLKKPETHIIAEQKRVGIILDASYDMVPSIATKHDSNRSLRPVEEGEQATCALRAPIARKRDADNDVTH